MLLLQVCAAESLSHCDQGSQFLISHLLKGTQQTSFEEHLRDKGKYQHEFDTQKNL
ncbi:hypothetical protein AALO_G00166370 [Alosa alosa]|uniref:Uncharacterized protein n=1 Tax=Alosa alosa TaxID=278164 RepID=A0AAV6GBK6_9TELE|nr:hypothetical protein AALO_G00166370 [Alosa alosa]